MSVTKHIVCRTCKQYLWIGQGGHLYTAGKHIAALTEFVLVSHCSSSHNIHELVVTDEHEYGDGLLQDCEDVSRHD